MHGRVTRLLILAVAQATEPVQVGHGNALNHLRVEEQLGAAPGPVSEKKRRRQRVARLPLRAKAVESVGNLSREGRVHLPDVRGLEVHIPIFGSQCPSQPGRATINLDGGGSNGGSSGGYFRGRRPCPGRQCQTRRTRNERECDFGKEADASVGRHGFCV